MKLTGKEIDEKGMEFFYRHEFRLSSGSVNDGVYMTSMYKNDLGRIIAQLRYSKHSPPINKVDITNQVFAVENIPWEGELYEQDTKSKSI